MKRLFILAVITVLILGTIQESYADEFVFTDGAGEAAPNMSPGTGFSTATRDNEAHMLLVKIGFSCLLGIATVSQFHSDTAVPGPSAAEVAKQVPSLSLSVTSGTLDLINSTSSNPSFITTNGGTPAGAQAAIFIGTTQGRDLNIQTTQFPGGENGVVSAIPEPATLLLLGSGLAGIASLVRWRLNAKDNQT